MELKLSHGQLAGLRRSRFELEWIWHSEVILGDT